MDKYAVIGNPVEHSLSPLIHRAFAKQTGQTFSYEKIKAPVDGFLEALHRFQKEGGKGLNVTLPFKKAAYECASHQSVAAEAAKAASVLQLNDDGSVFADNYDGLGLVKDLQQNHQVNLVGKDILIIGAGGAVQGILGALFDALVEQITIVNRTANKAIALAHLFVSRGKVCGVGFDALEIKPYDILIHATSLGHQQKTPHLPSALVATHTCCYDLSYGKAAQPFLNWAKSQGAKLCSDGIGMLVEHNAAAFHLWRGIYPDTRPVIETLRALPKNMS